MMNLLPTKTGTRGFTLLEALIVLATVFLLFIVVGPMLYRPTHPAPRIVCMMNLKQVGLAFRLWAADHNDLMPMEVSTNQGGSKEFIGEAFRHFAVLSNELTAPKVLICPSDKQRAPASKFKSLSNQNLSYFVAVDAVTTNAPVFLSGDRHLTTNDAVVPPGLHTFTANTKMGWAKAIHQGYGGNIGFTDGSVEQTSPTKLQRAWEAMGTATNRLAIP